MLLEPHEGLSGDHVAGGADGLPPFVDGPLPLLLRATCGAGPGPQGQAGAPRCPGRQAQNPGSMLGPRPRGSGPAPPSRPSLCPAPRQLPPGAGWAPGAGTSLLTALVGAGPLFRTSSGTGPSCFLARWMRALSSALARPTRARGRGRCRLRARPPRVLGPTGARLAQASPLSPKVPEMEGCSPVNFLGVFCFLPDSGERTHRTRLWSNNRWEARAGWPPPPPAATPCSRLTVLRALRTLLRRGQGARGPRRLLAPQGSAAQRKGAAAGVCAQLEG